MGRDPNNKEILKRSVLDYLESETPELVEEYKVVFDDVYETIECRLKDDSSQTTGNEEVGLAFEVGLVSGTMISVACWIGIKFLVAATKVTARENIPQALDSMEKKLIGWNCRPEMVRRLRERIQKYLMEAFS